MFVGRIVAERCRTLARSFPALVLTGARQSGKTHLLKTLFPEHSYISLDLPSVAEQAEKDPSSFFRDHPPPVLVDEVQYAPGLFRHVKALIDADRHAMGRFILTGSQSFPLMKEVSDSLAGRCVLFELENLSLSELLAGGLVAKDSTDWPALLCRGQFPELWRNPSIGP